MTDPIGDLLTRIRNAQAARKDGCSAPWSVIKQQLCELLVQGGWLQSVTKVGEEPHFELDVVFVPGKKLELKRVSTPGRRLYAGADDLKPVLNGYGVAVLTTSQGLLTDREAKKRRIGGEILCTIS
jgi:small subunit ribosomal protein S8